jgi:hypothetical protein
MKQFLPKSRQTQQIFTALILTSILSLGAGTTFVNPAAAKSIGSPEGVAGLKQRNRQVPPIVINAVRREIARTDRIRVGQLKVVSATQQSWSDSCLGLGGSAESCAQIFIENGWRIVMSDGAQTWTARTDGAGRIVRLEDQNNQSNNQLPDSVARTVLRAASQESGLRRSELRIVGSQQIQGSSSCLGLSPRSGQGCTRDLAPLWQVTVEGNQQRWVYHTNMDGSRIRLNEEASNMGNGNLPQSIAAAVLEFASQDLGVSGSRLRITQAQKQVWGDSCLGLPRPTERCIGTPTPGWQVTVEGRQRTQVYRTDDSGSRIRSEAILGEVPFEGKLPDAVAQAVLQDASRQSNGYKKLRIVQAERQDWPNGCLGLAERGVFCTQAIVPGWRVMVESGQQTFVYRTNESGSVIKLENGAVQGNGGAIPMAESELPSPLGQGVVFRAIAGGGFTGRTTETLLMNDGRVIRRFTNPMIKAPVQMHQISRQQLRQFQQLLEQRNFAQFDRLVYPAPSGAADYITVTLTSQAGTTSYADMGQDRLPQPLQQVIEAWNQIASGR